MTGPARGGRLFCRGAWRRPTRQKPDSRRQSTFLPPRVLVGTETSFRGAWGPTRCPAGRSYAVGWPDPTRSASQPAAPRNALSELAGGAPIDPIRRASAFRCSHHVDHLRQVPLFVYRGSLGARGSIGDTRKGCPYLQGVPDGGGPETFTTIGMPLPARSALTTRRECSCD
jgi:hypothetical protein